MTSISSHTDAPSISRFIDSHCHLDDASFHDLDDVIERSRDLGVDRWINIGFGPNVWESTIALAERIDGMSCALGLHPGHAELCSDSLLRDLHALVAHHQPVAIGEIGLDFYRGETNMHQQVGAFEAQLAVAVEFDVPAVIHMRDSEQLILEVLNHQSRLPQLLFHSFEGSRELTRWILDHDAMIGVGGLVTRTRHAHVREELIHIPLDRIMLETDSPYLVPNGFKHRRNTPESIPVIARHVARLKGTGNEIVAQTTTANCERFFARLRRASTLAVA